MHWNVWPMHSHVFWSVTNDDTAATRLDVALQGKYAVTEGRHGTHRECS
jgi:hypothetical protein